MTAGKRRAQVRKMTTAPYEWVAILFEGDQHKGTSPFSTRAGARRRARLWMDDAR